MSNHAIGGQLFKDMVIAGAALLERNKEHINQLNVFPVPDGDTGTNMCMTIQSAVKELRSLPEDADVSKIANALSMGALKGARGNSGVILSQIFRGFSKALKGVVEMDAEMFSKALTMGTEAAYKAVMRPKEGTMLTVARMVSESAAEDVQKGANVYTLIDTILESGEKALAMTPDLLPVLKEAGVVDSGGKGLMTIYRGFKMAIDGEELEDVVMEAQPEAAVSLAEEVDLEDLEDIRFGYCTEFFITHLNENFQESDLDSFREKMISIGDSVVVAYEGDLVKVHVHSNAPGKILQMALRFGEINHVKIDNMREQNRELQEAYKRNEKEYGMVAVCAGEGICNIFRDLGVGEIINGGQTMNPSIDTIRRAIHKVNARNVFILPNNSNIIMAAQQAAKLSDRNVVVLPTKTIPQGISAAVAFDASMAAGENEECMKEAIANVLSGSVTYAVRNTVYQGENIRKDDIIGMLEGEIAAVGQNQRETATNLLRKMLEQSQKEEAVVTILCGLDGSQQEASAIVDEMQNDYPDMEFMVEEGGQPLYYYYFSVE